MTLTPDERLRYSRQIRLPQVGECGQEKLRDARVLVVGAGGLGNPVALYLAAAGCGHITLVDDDTVDVSNLQRQVAFDTSDVGHSKAERLAERCRALNPSITVNAVNSRFHFDNAEALVAAVDICVDATDNLATRYLLNDTCVALQVPWIYGSVLRFEGQCALFAPQGSCYRCLFPKEPQNVQNCAEAGVFGMLPGTIATFQANLVIQHLLGLAKNLAGQLVTFDGFALKTQHFHLPQEPDCPTCSQPKAVILSRLNTQREDPACQWIPTFTRDELASHTNYLLIDVREPDEYERHHLPGSLLIPMSRLEQDGATLARDKPLYVYCASGRRSERAARYFLAKGYTVRHLKGGLG